MICAKIVMHMFGVCCCGVGMLSTEGPSSLFIYLFIYLCVCLLATLRKNYWTDFAQTFREYSTCPIVKMINFWVQKVKGQGQGRRKGQKRIFGHISASS